MSKLPVIGISGSILTDQGGIFPGYERAYVNYDYCTSIVRNGGAPFIIPVHNDEDVIARQVEQIDALILSGGQDVFPQNYGQEPKLKLGDTFPARDAFEFKLIQLAMEKQIPILGICRGFQILNVYFGGTLYQDASYIDNGKEPVKHWQGHQPTLQTHSVTIEKNSKLHEIIGQEKILVNSFHHQCVDQVGAGLRVLAQAEDGVVESIEKEDYPFLLGVQWHPEMLSKEVDSMAAIFRTLIKSSK